MFLLLKLAVLGAACLFLVGMPLTVALLWFAKHRPAAKQPLRLDSIGTLAAAVTVLSFLVALTCLGWPDNSWLKTNPIEPGAFGIHWCRDR